MIFHDMIFWGFFLHTKSPTMGRKSVAVAVLLVTFVAAATIKDNKSAAMSVDMPSITSASCELTHSDNPED